MTHLTYPNESAEYRAARNPAGGGNGIARAYRSRRGAAPRPAPGRHRTGGLRLRADRQERHARERSDVQSLWPTPYADPLQLHVRPSGTRPARCARSCSTPSTARPRISTSAHRSTSSLNRRSRAWSHGRAIADGHTCGSSSTAGNRYDADYFGDTSKLPAAVRNQHDIKEAENYDGTAFNVFRLDNGVICHFWGSELSWTPPKPAMGHRSGDAVSALWACST